MLQLVLYLCSEEPDMPEIEHPVKRRRLSGSVRPPEEPRVWDVGVRISNANRHHREQTVANAEPSTAPSFHASPRPHVRRRTGIHIGQAQETLSFLCGNL